MYAQQKWMYEIKRNVCANRIVSLYQPPVRPIVRGKEGRNTELGSKINASEVNGFSWVNILSWDAFNEGGNLKNQVEDYRKTFNCYPKTLMVNCARLSP
jgi:transposase, IS5 family